MGRADARASQINHAAIDLAEAVMLRGREGETFKAVVTDVATSVCAFSSRTCLSLPT